MTHQMKLKSGPFEKINNGTKTVELRLYDEKRKLLKINDYIEFTNIEDGRKLLVLIEDIRVFDSFDTIYDYYDKVAIGYNIKDKADPKDMEEYYSKEEQSKYGVVAISIKKIN